MNSFLKHNGYVWESGLSGHYTYGPMGKALKNKIENYIRMLFRNNGFNEIDTPLILKKEVWETSGHWDKFRDPVISTKSGKCYRIDKLFEKEYPKVIYSELSSVEILKMLDELNATRKDDPFVVKKEIEERNLMMTTQSGSNVAGLRPETATATFNNFTDMFQYNKGVYPVKFFQIGKSFRNEISPKNGIIRGREFTQAEFQIVDEKMAGKTSE